ncbi:MAG: hypothetical protein JO054_03910, partial [Actinobacteria bacterium]|nr:hypothetical protein [Actinomycetota bacterium]
MSGQKSGAWESETVRHIGVGERRARLARRHLLAPGSEAASAVEAAAGVVALHATDPGTVFLSI